jgi:hypothetical protein
MKLQILSIPRSGSAYLRTMLNHQMRDFDSYYTISEPFNKSKAHLETHYNQNYIIQNIIDNKNVLVKSHIHELIDNDPIIIKKYLNVNWTTICLLRRDIFEASLSRAISLTTGIWDDCHPANSKLIFKFKEFKKYIDETLLWTDLIMKNSLNLTYHTIIFYEDLKFNSQEDLNLLNIPLQHKSFYNTSRLYLKSNVVENYIKLKNESQNYLDSITIK